MAITSLGSSLGGLSPLLLNSWGGNNSSLTNNLAGNEGLGDGLQDQLNLSPEIKKAMAESQLKQRLKEVESAAAEAKDHPEKLEAAKKALGNDYQQVKGQSIPLDRDLEKQVKTVLGIADEQGSDSLSGSGGGGRGGGSDGGGGGMGSLLDGLGQNFGGGGGGGGGMGGATNLNGRSGFGGGGGRTYPPRPMSEQDHGLLEGALNKPAGHNGDLIGGWRQTREGNCASVGVIKAAMQEYGNKVFKDVQRSGEGYQVTMQDGRTMNLSGQELAFSRSQAQFAGNDKEALTYAEFCYSVMAKNHSTNHRVSLEAACHDLNNGFDPRESAHILGLGKNLARYDGVNGVAWNGSHCEAKINGRYDHYGRASGGFADHYNFSFRPMPSQTWTTQGNQGSNNLLASNNSPRSSAAPSTIRTTTPQRTNSVVPAPRPITRPVTTTMKRAG